MNHSIASAVSTPFAISMLAFVFSQTAYRYIEKRYDYFFSQCGFSVFNAYLLTVLSLIVLLFIKLEKLDDEKQKEAFYQFYPQFKRNPFRFGDPIRFFIQSGYLSLYNYRMRHRTHISNKIKKFAFNIIPNLLKLFVQLDSKVSSKMRNIKGLEDDVELPSYFQKLVRAQFWEHPNIRNAILAGVLLLVAIFITVPFSLEAQAVFMGLILFVAYSMRGIKGRMPTIIMITLSVSTSSRYLWWRYTETINWEDPVALTLGLGLLFAETYAWLVLILGFFQTIRPLKRKPAPLPDDMSLWPSVDIYIPTYNEPLNVVKPTTIAAMALDWPKDKLNIYILDDGKRDEFREFAEEIGVNYMIRPDNNHAKAGNMNHAMQYTHGELIAIFDCDHVPVRSFLQMTVGSFVRDRKMCLVQTPHHFFSADPFEKNLGNFAQTPNENMLFYGLIQDGNDMWDATFFCGSCAVIRRSAIEEIGGFAFETVTEDAHTALRMQRQGYRTAYINIPQAAGLATDSLSAHVGQRIRWARGMAQIFRVDNPLLGKGLSLPQRLCYLNAALHFFSGIPRIIFLTAPLALLFFNAYIIYAPFLAIMLYVIPTLLQVKITNSRIQGKWRYSFWGEVYESVLAWYILKPTTVALFAPNKGKFNVTEKGGLTDSDFYDWDISKPYLFLALLNILGLFIGFARMMTGDPIHIGVILISMAWAGYNIIILGAAIAVAAESKQVRKSHRISCRFSAVIKDLQGRTTKVKVTDFSDIGLGITLPSKDIFTTNEKVEVIMTRGHKQFSFPATVINTRAEKIGIILRDITPEIEKAFVECTFCRADAWLTWQDNFEQDDPSRSFKNVRKTSARGFRNIIYHAPPNIKPIIQMMLSLIAFINSYLPKRPTVEDNINNEKV